MWRETFGEQPQASVYLEGKEQVADASENHAEKPGLTQPGAKKHSRRKGKQKLVFEFNFTIISATRSPHSTHNFSPLWLLSLSSLKQFTKTSMFYLGSLMLPLFPCIPWTPLLPPPNPFHFTFVLAPPHMWPASLTQRKHPPHLPSHCLFRRASRPWERKQNMN